MDTLREKNSLSEIPMIILAGGFGTRLSTVVQDVPKPLAPVAGRPFLHYLIGSFLKQGIRKFIFLVHHKSELMQQYIQSEMHEGLLRGCDCTVVHEEVPLGTGGAVANAVRELDLEGRFFVANADTYMESGLAELAASKAPCIASVNVEDCSRYGLVKSMEGRVQRFEEKRENAGSGDINAGLYFLDSEIFNESLPQAFSMEKDVFEKLAEMGKLRVAKVNSVFIDIGIPEDYYRFCQWIEQEQKGQL